MNIARRATFFPPRAMPKFHLEVMKFGHGPWWKKIA